MTQKNKKGTYDNNWARTQGQKNTEESATLQHHKQQLGKEQKRSEEKRQTSH
jgi:hypothetical protein